MRTCAASLISSNAGGLTESLVKHLMGAKTTAVFHPDGRNSKNEYGLDSKRPWLQYDMFMTLEARGEGPERRDAAHGGGAPVRARAMPQVEYRAQRASYERAPAGQARWRIHRVSCVSARLHCLPQAMSPLTRYHWSRPGLYERPPGLRVRKGWSVRARFKEQVRQKEQDDDEAQGFDETFVGVYVSPFVASAFYLIIPPCQAGAWYLTDARMGYYLAMLLSLDRFCQYVCLCAT
ncbi:uncharacterized protein PHACADRAFT_210617, partial [Phanerochaete carnosa HHB-10118-sp]